MDDESNTGYLKENFDVVEALEIRTSSIVSKKGENILYGNSAAAVVALT